jgi:hypothetical protein
LGWLHQGCDGDLAAFFRLAADDYPFDFVFNIFFRLRRRDPVLELQFLLPVLARLCTLKLPCVKVFVTVCV